MNRINRLIAIMLAGAMALSMAACGSTEENTESSADDIVTLRILENDTAKDKGYLDTLLKAFNEAYKDKGIQAVDANMDEYTDLAENGPYGYGPDVLYQANDKLMTYAEDKHLMAVTPEDYDCYSATSQEAWKAFQINVDGKTYTCGVPVNVQEPMMFYRQDLLPENWESSWDDDEDGKPDFFQNWNDLYRYSKELVEAGSYGYMSSLNNLYLNSNFLFSYGAYVFGKAEDGTVDSTDIGFSSGDAAKGISAMIQFAAIMNEGCIDDTITANRYQALATGEYFCTVSTPDTYTVFVEKLQNVYMEKDGLSEKEAYDKAVENVKMIELPALMPADGDLTKDADTMSDGDWVETVVMGGINGYGISAYTEHRDECIEFVNFATSFDMIAARADMLGIAATRSDVAAQSGETSDMIFASLEAGRIELMPSVKAVDQIWTPVQTLMGDFAKDPYRSDNEKKYGSESAIQDALEKADKDVYDAIYTLAN